MSERLTHSRNSPEEIEAFVRDEWGKHQVQFALLENLTVRVCYLENLLEETETDEFDDEEFRRAFQQHLIKLLGAARRWHHRLQVAGQTGSDAREKPETEAKSQTAGAMEVEKIDFGGSVAQFVYFWELLFQLENGLNLKQYDRRWSLLSRHFTIRGRVVTSDTLKSTASNMINNKSKTPRAHEGFLALVRLLEKLPEEVEAFLSQESDP